MSSLFGENVDVMLSLISRQTLEFQDIQLAQYYVSNLFLFLKLFFGKDEKEKRKGIMVCVQGHSRHILREFHRVYHSRFRSKKFANYLQVEEIQQDLDSINSQNVLLLR